MFSSILSYSNPLHWTPYKHDCRVWCSSFVQAAMDTCFQTIRQGIELLWTASAPNHARLLAEEGPRTFSFLRAPENWRVIKVPQKVGALENLFL